MRTVLAVLADAAAQSADRASLYALLGVIGAALLTAVGGIVTAQIGKRRDREAERLDKSPGEVEILSRSYSDCRTDLTAANTRISVLEHELDEQRSLAEYLLRTITKTHPPGGAL